MVCQGDNDRLGPRGSIGADNLDGGTKFGYPTSVGLFVDFSPVSLHQNRLITGVGDLPPTTEGTVEGQSWREYRKEDCPSSFLLLRASTGSRACCKAGCIDIKASRWILRTYHARCLLQPHRATFWFYLTPGHLQGRAQTSYSMPAPKWVRSGTLSQRKCSAPRVETTRLHTRSVRSSHVLTGTVLST